MVVLLCEPLQDLFDTINISGGNDLMPNTLLHDCLVRVESRDSRVT